MTLVTLKNLQFEMNLGTIKKWKLENWARWSGKKTKAKQCASIANDKTVFFFEIFFFG